MKLFAYLALVGSTAADPRWLADAAVGSGKQPKGEACTAWVQTFEELRYGTLWTNEDKITADEADAMDDDAKLEWMAKNIYDPAGDTCAKGETCVL